MEMCAIDNAYHKLLHQILYILKILNASIVVETVCLARASTTVGFSIDNGVTYHSGKRVSVQSDWPIIVICILSRARCCRSVEGSNIRDKDINMSLFCLFQAHVKRNENNPKWYLLGYY